MLTVEQKEYIKRLDEKTAIVELHEEIEGYKFLIIENVLIARDWRTEYFTISLMNFVEKKKMFSRKKKVEIIYSVKYSYKDKWDETTEKENLLMLSEYKKGNLRLIDLPFVRDMFYYVEEREKQKKKEIELENLYNEFK
ncbi:hypothetical protein ZYGNAAKF_CDS0200 [Enterococcus phage VRE9_2]